MKNFQITTRSTLSPNPKLDPNTNPHNKTPIHTGG